MVCLCLCANAWNLLCFVIVSSPNACWELAMFEPVLVSELQGNTSLVRCPGSAGSQAASLRGEDVDNHCHQLLQTVDKEDAHSVFPNVPAVPALLSDEKPLVFYWKQKHDCAHTLLVKPSAWLHVR